MDTDTTEAALDAAIRFVRQFKADEFGRVEVPELDVVEVQTLARRLVAARDEVKQLRAEVRAKKDRRR